MFAPAVRRAFLAAFAATIATATACGGDDDERVTRLTIRVSAVSGGFTVRRDIACTGGETTSRDAAICAAIDADRALLQPRLGRPRSCPHNARRVIVRGEHLGEPVATEFSVCRTGQGVFAIRWLRLLRLRGNSGR